MPVGDVLVRDAGRDVKHDDAALAIDVVAIAKTAKLLLAGGIPDVKLDLAKVLSRISCRPPAIHLFGRTYGLEAKRVDLDTERGHVFLLEFTRQVALDEGSLERTSKLASSPNRFIRGGAQA